jgi:hypothetical protein
LAAEELMKESCTAEEIDAIAAAAGLKLTPEWRDELVKGSRFVLIPKRLLRTKRDLSAEPAHIFTTRQG